jgi:hypothetical protein
VYTLFGFPGVWTDPITKDDGDRLCVKPLEYRTYAFDGSVSSVTGYEARLHVLLSGGSEDLSALDGQPDGPGGPVSEGRLRG